MNILTVEGITKSFGERKLLDEASFYMDEGEKAGIIGVNGTGKSTLLKLLAGMEEPDEGRIVKAGHVIVEYLPQHPVFPEGETVLQAALSGRTKENGRTAPVEESSVKAMLTRLGVTDFEARCDMLSGGERKRLALVAALLAPADLLLLDEPTNHLDHGMADWLEETLRSRRGAVLLVTHDRYFLDRVTDRILEIDRGRIYSCYGGYSGYLEQKAQREEAALAGERKRQSLLRTELAWVRRGARARSTKQKARLERFETLQQTQLPVGDEKVQMDSVSARLGKSTLEARHLYKSYGERTLIRDFSYIFLKGDRIGFLGPNGCGKTTLMKLLTGACAPDEGSVTVGQTVKIGCFSQELPEELLSAEGGADRNRSSGGSSDRNRSSRGSSDRNASGLRVIDYIREVAEYVNTGDGSLSASQLLERFLFAGSEQYTPVGKLSGGEKRRLQLLRVLMGAPNVLILDEPTNDLDIATLTVLEDYLDRFAGIVITVSHDRYFLDRTVRRIFAFEKDGSLRQYEGGYSDYLLRRQEEEAVQREAGLTRTSGKGTPSHGASGKERAAGQPLGKDTAADGPSEKKDRRSGPKKLRFTWQEQRDYETIEAQLAELEQQLEQLDREILVSATDFVKLNELTQKKEQTKEKLDERMERWLYLEELSEKIAQAQG